MEGVAAIKDSLMHSATPPPVSPWRFLQNRLYPILSNSASCVSLVAQVSVIPITSKFPEAALSLNLCNTTTIGICVETYQLVRSTHPFVSYHIPVAIQHYSVFNVSCFFTILPLTVMRLISPCCCRSSS
jgi:hypothetical protein